MSQTSKTYQYDRNDNNTFGVRGKADECTVVKANETLAGTEDSLTELTIGTTKYKVDQPINVVANPTLAGTEASLTGLEVGTTKYAIPTGYTIHTYTANKTYTSADSNYQQLVDDLTAGHDIKINDIIFKFIYKAGDTYRYSAFGTGMTSNYVSTYCIAIDKSGSDYTFYNPVNTALGNVTALTSTPPVNLRTGLTIAGTDYSFVSKQSYYLTTAPSSANTSGYLQFVVLSSEPATYYNGYYYIIAPTT